MKKLSKTAKTAKTKEMGPMKVIEMQLDRIG